MSGRDVTARTNMVILLLGLNYLSCPGGHSSAERRMKTRSSGRIVGGENATQFEFPSIVQLLRSSGGPPACGATVINREWLLTGAHCVVDDGRILPLNFYYIRAGNILLNSMPGEQILNITRIVPHERYDIVKSLNHDIALLRVHPEIRFGKYVQPINLPKCKEEILPGPGDGEVWAVGWGRNETPTGENPRIPVPLQKIKSDVISNEQCKKDALIHRMDVFKTTLCVKNEGDKGTCFGDSGGPLYLRKGHTLTQIGILSSLDTSGICEGGWAFYTKLSRYVGWVHRRIAECGNFRATPFPQDEGKE